MRIKQPMRVLEDRVSVQVRCCCPMILALLCAVLFHVVAAGRSETKDGLEVHMQTNHLCHFLLTLGLLPALQRGVQQPPQRPQHSSAAQAPAGTQAPFRPRIVSVASAMHHFGYKFGPEDPLLKQRYSTTLAYGNSKLAQVTEWCITFCHASHSLH